MITAENFLLIGSVLIFISILISKAGYKFGIPTLFLFLVIGMFFGSDGLGIQFNSASDAQLIGMMALSIILFSGGMDTKISEVKPVMLQGVLLSTVGVLLTTILTGLFIFYISGWSSTSVQLGLLTSMLLAATLSSTDSASVFNLLRSQRMNLKYNLGLQFLFGGVIGYAAGKFSVWLINKVNLSNSALYPILLLSLVFVTFTVTDLVKGNGYLAVYIAGVIVGNARLVNRKEINTFMNGLTWLVQIVMFLSLGLLVNPHEMLDMAGSAMLIGIFMILVARPLSVFACLLPFRKMSGKARVFVSWVGLRGAVPIIFATYPVVANIPGADSVFNIVFFITLLSLLLQGMSISVMARWLKLDLPLAREGNEFGVEVPEETETQLKDITLGAADLANGNRLADMNLPAGTLVMLVKRGNEFMIPNGQLELHAGDKLLLISENRTKETLTPNGH